MNYLKELVKPLQQRTRKKDSDADGETREVLQREDALTLHPRLENNPCFRLRPRTRTKNGSIIVASAFIFVMLMTFQECREPRALSDYIGNPEEHARSELPNLPNMDSIVKKWILIWDGVFPGSNESSSGQQRNIKDTENGQASATLPSKSLDIKKLQGENVSALGVFETFEIFPPSSHPDTIQIYDEKAYFELIHSFVLNKRKFKICTSGGSSTAGGGSIAVKDRFFMQLDRHLRSLDAFGGRGSEVIDRSHGGRTSMHSAIFFPNFVPPDVDLLIWEFAINDYPYSNLIPESSQAVQTQAIFLSWLREVERISPKPPKVILVYLWKTPFQLNGDGMIDNPVYDFHANLAREFDFVVGHVNLASYFDNELENIDFETKRRLFLADQHHPSHAGHVAISFLLLNLLRGEGVWMAPKDNAVERILRTNYMWYCGEETEEKKFLQKLITEKNSDSIPSWRSPLGTMTLELPQNNNEAMSDPRQLIYDFKGAPIKILGKQDPLRNDRKGSIDLPCCKSDPSMYITLKTPYDSKPMLGARALFLAFAIGMSDVSVVKVYINAEKKFIHGRLLEEDTRNMPCFWNWAAQFHTRWFAFSDKVESISSLSLCVENEQCLLDAASGAMMVASAVY